MAPSEACCPAFAPSFEPSFELRIGGKEASCNSTILLTHTHRPMGPAHTHIAGHRSIVSPRLNGYAGVAGCTQGGMEWDNGYTCSVEVRRLNVWSASNRGTLRLEGPGYANVGADWQPPTFGLNGGHLQYDDNWIVPYGGYGAPVVAGGTYTLTGLGDLSGVALAYSDAILQQVTGNTGTPSAFLHSYIPAFLHSYTPTLLHSYIPTFPHSYTLHSTCLHSYMSTPYIPTPYFLHPTFLHSYIHWNHRHSRNHAHRGGERGRCRVQSEVVT